MYINSSQFSEREKDVARLLLQGKGNKQIALELEISSRTVEFHLSNIYAKLHVSSRAEAILKLTESYLRESTGGVQVHSTVAQTGDITENGFKSILRRSPVKKLYTLIGGLLAAIIIIVVVILKPATQSPASQPISTSEINITVPPAAIPATPASTETSPPTIQPTSIVIAPHTVNGYTAAIESYYIDTSHILFQVSITGAEITSGNQHHYLGMGIPNQDSDVDCQMLFLLL